MVDRKMDEKSVFKAINVLIIRIVSCKLRWVDKSFQRLVYLHTSLRIALAKKRIGKFMLRFHRFVEGVNNRIRETRNKRLVDHMTNAGKELRKRLANKRKF